MIVRAAAALAAGAAVLLVAPPARAADRPAVAFTLDDPRIAEASGIAPGLRNPGVVYVQNDSGDGNRVFAVSRATGRTRAVVTVAGATNVDWEDLAVARDAAGVPSVWIADTGDNDAERRDVRVYRVPEPRLASADVTTRAVTWRLTYPDGPVDAEALAVAPGGTAYVVTKSYLGASVVYRLPKAAGRGTLARVAELTVRPSGTRGGPSELGALAQLSVTGAAFSAGGSRFAVRTYTDAYVWAVSGGDLASALRRAPVRVALPRQRQGEGIAFADAAGTTLLVDSEGTSEPVWSVPLPRIAAVPTSRTGAPSTAPSAAPSTTPSAPSSAPASSGTIDDPADDDPTGPSNLRYVIGAGVVIVLGGLSYTWLHRRNRRT
ncbi:hypothetical protein [Jatrophihabitans fulvus]